MNIGPAVEVTRARSTHQDEAADSRPCRGVGRTERSACLDECFPTRAGTACPIRSSHPARLWPASCRWANPVAAVTIDTETFPPEVLTIRGRVEISEAEGIPAEYASAAWRYLGDEAARAYLAQIDQPVTRMARIDLHPAWVGVHDFQSRLPSALGGIS